MKDAKIKEKTTESPNYRIVCTWFNIRRASRAITQYFDNYLRPYGIRVTQGNILGILHFKGESSITELAEFLFMDRTTLTRNIKPLHRKGLLSVNSGSDKRTKILTITDKGSELIQKVFPHWKEANQHFIKGMGGKNWNELIDRLSEVLELTSSDIKYK